MGDAKHAGELGLEVLEGSQCRLGGVDVVEGALQKVVELIIRVLGFHGHFKQLAKICGEQGGGVVSPQPLPPVANGDFTKGMKVALAGAAERDLAAEEQIDLSVERAFRPAGTFCYGFDQALGF